jgi:hypothetical protein
MAKQLPAAGVVCGEFQKLLQESTVAKEAWRKLRAEICWTQLVPKETVDELLRLQAKYARAYAVLCKHLHTCFQCRRLVSRIA